jgi:hypothetical protein
MHRQTALRDLYPAATSVPRAGASVLALAVAVLGAHLLAPGIAGEPMGPLQPPVLLIISAVLVVAAAVVAVLLQRAGTPPILGTLAWAVLPTVITEDGRRQSRPGPLTARQQVAVEECRRLLVPGPLRLRQVCAGIAVLLALGAVVLAIRPMIDQSRAYANDATLGALAEAIVRVVATVWLAIASGVGAWRLTLARNGGTGPGGDRARTWVLRRAGIDVGDRPTPDAAGRDADWNDDTPVALPEAAGPGGAGVRLSDGGIFTSLPTDDGRAGYHPGPQQGAGGPGAGAQYSYGGAPGYASGSPDAAGYVPSGPPPGYGPGPAPSGQVQGAPWQAGPPPQGEGPQGQHHGGPAPQHGFLPGSGQAGGAGPAPASPGPGVAMPAGYGQTGGYAPPARLGAGSPETNRSPDTGPPIREWPDAQVGTHGGPDPSQAGPGDRVPAEGGAPAGGPSSGGTYVAHAAPAWRVTGLWEDVPPVRVGGYLLDGGISLVGRDPDPLEGEVVDNLMVVPDGAVSKTHLSVRLSATALHAIDRGSRNGTTLVHADGTTEKLQPWVEIELPEGAALRIGSSLLERDAPWEDDEDDVGRTMLR